MEKSALLTLVMLSVLLFGCTKKNSDPLAGLDGTWHCNVKNKIAHHIGFTVYIDTTIDMTTDMDIVIADHSISVRCMGYNKNLQLEEMGASFDRNDATCYSCVSFETGHVNSTSGCGLKKYIRFYPADNKVVYEYVEDLCGDHVFMTVTGIRQ